MGLHASLERKHRRRTRARLLQERDPALINLPFPIPSIPILGPLLSPLIGGEPWPSATSTSTTQASSEAQTTTTPSQTTPASSDAPSQASSSTSQVALTTSTVVSSIARSETATSFVPSTTTVVTAPALVSSSASSTPTVVSSIAGSPGSETIVATSLAPLPTSAVGTAPASDSSSASSSGSANGEDPSESTSSLDSSVSSSSSGSATSPAPTSVSGAVDATGAASISIISEGATGSATYEITYATTTAIITPVAIENIYGGSSASAASNTGASAYAITNTTDITAAGASVLPSTTAESISGSNDSNGSSSSGSTPSSSSPASQSSSASHHRLSNGDIAAIAILAAIVLVLLIICLLRKRHRSQRLARRKYWLFGASKHRGYGQATGDGPTHLYNQLRSPTPETTAIRNSVGSNMAFASRSTFPHSPISPVLPSLFPPVTMPPVGRQVRSGAEVDDVWPSNLSGSISAPTNIATTDSEPLPVLRSPDHLSWDSAHAHSDESTGSSFSLAIPHNAALSDRSAGVPTPMTVRPFSPSEAWMFPKPPRASRDSSSSGGGVDITTRAAQVVTPDHSTLEHDDSGMSSEYATAPENPFSDADAASSSECAHTADAHSVESRSTVDAETALHFARTETIRRAFAPAMEDEIAVAPGELVRMLRWFDDGWAYAEKIGSGQRGFIPIDCLRMPEEDLPAFLAAKRLSSYHADDSGYGDTEHTTFGEAY